MRYRPHAVPCTFVLCPTLSASEQAMVLCELHCSPALAAWVQPPFPRPRTRGWTVSQHRDQQCSRQLSTLKYFPSEETAFNAASENYSNACESCSSFAHSKPCSTKRAVCALSTERSSPETSHRHHGEPVGAGLLQARASKDSSSPVRPGAPKRNWSPQGFPCKAAAVT